MFITTAPACHADKNFQDTSCWSHSAMKSLFHTSKEKVRVRCKKNASRLLAMGEPFHRDCALYSQSQLLPKWYCFRKTRPKFSLLKRHKCSCENSRTAQTICLLGKTSGGLSFHPLAGWANSHSIFSLVPNKDVPSSSFLPLAPSS